MGPNFRAQRSQLEERTYERCPVCRFEIPKPDWRSASSGHPYRGRPAHSTSNCANSIKRLRPDVLRIQLWAPVTEEISRI